MTAGTLGFFGDYDAVRLIARGGMGAIYEGRSRTTGAAVAIKTITPTRDPVARERFQREGELLARCDRHPGVVKVHALGETPDRTPYLVLELVRGETLDALLEREGTLAPERAARLALDIARALAFLHERGIVHRDLKPANVLLDADAGGAPRLTDFGLATATELERLTKTGFFVGTVLYTSPEQATNEPIGPAADVFALGVILFEALTGQRPIESANAEVVLAHLCGAEPLRRVRDVRSDLPLGLSWIVDRALFKRAADRYANGAAIARDLESWLTNGEVELPRVERIRRSSSKIALAVVVAAGLFVALSAFAITLQQRRQVERAAEAAREESALALALVDRAARTGPPFESALLAEARAHATQAVVEAKKAGGDPKLVARAEAAIRSVQVADAAALYRDEKYELALAEIDALAEPISGQERLVRLRALVGLGRLRDAESEATRLDGESRDARANALELIADARMDREECQAALALFSTALDLATTKTKELRLKRGAAAAKVLDDRTALADLTAIFSDLEAIPDDRNANAAIAPFAASIYRRAIAASDETARMKDLEIAWRMATPPRELASEVARIWAAWPHGKDKGPDIGRKVPTPEEVAILKRRAQLAKRALAIDPNVDLADLWEWLQWLRLSFQRHEDAVASRRVIDSIVEAWPEHPTFVLISAYAHETTTPEQARDLWQRLARGVALLPPRRPAEPGEIAALAQSIARVQRRVAVELKLVEADLEPLRKTAERADNEPAREDYERAVRFARRPFLGGTFVEGESLEVISKTGGAVSVTASSAASGGAVLAWKGAKLGDAIVLRLPSSIEGRRKLAFVFEQPRDAPIVKISINGATVIERVDLHGNAVFSSPEAFGDATLAAGANELRIEVVDSVAQAGRVFTVELDYVRFVPD